MFFASNSSKVLSRKMDARLSHGCGECNTAIKISNVLSAAEAAEAFNLSS